MRQFYSLLRASSQGTRGTVPQPGCLRLDCSSLPTHRGAIEERDPAEQASRQGGGGTVPQKTSRCSTSPCASMRQFYSRLRASSQGARGTVPQRGCLCLDCSRLPTHRGTIEDQDRC